MIRTTAFSLALLALPFSAAAQSTPDAGRAADAAEAVAAQARGSFERIDPDSEIPAGDDAAAVYAGLPPLTADDADAPRGPAVRMIDLPAPAPVAVEAPVPVAVAAEAPAPAPVAAPAPVPTPVVDPAPRAANDPFVIKSILPIEGTIRYGDWFWDESAAPQTGKLVITVDLEARVISAFRDGHEIGTAVVLVGTQKHPTPLGTFPILTKERDNVSEKYNNAPMPWTLRLTWDGIAIHGSPVLNGYASHGCIGVPDEFAAKLFAASKRGDKVIITRGRMIGIGDKVM
jgi:lipoprotein-anchoring transpeptidase ErfK/SrfK